MYKTAAAKLSSSAQMRTPMRLQIPTTETVLGVAKKGYADGDVIMCNFKTYGGTESESNGVLSVIDTAQITCWYRPDIKSDCRLKRLSDGALFEILGEPENLELSNKILSFKIRRVKGGA